MSEENNRSTQMMRNKKAALALLLIALLLGTYVLYQYSNRPKVNPIDPSIKKSLEFWDNAYKEMEK